MDSVFESFLQRIVHPVNCPTSQLRVTVSPVNTELSGFTVRAGRGFSGSDSDAGLISLIGVIGHSVLVFNEQ